jgi:hypothetical protein
VKSIVKHRHAAVLLSALVAVFAISIASPAFGGPSLAGIAKTAKKALKTAKAADEKATTALQQGGKPGPAGPAGPQGPQGAQGPAGAPGLANLERDHADASVPNGTVDQQYALTCPQGKVPLSGSYEFTGPAPTVSGSWVGSTDGTSTDAFIVKVSNTSGAARSIRIHIVCAAVNGGFPN